MELQIVESKTALLANELGFNEPCSHYYIKDFQNFKHDGILKKNGLPDGCENKNVFQFVTRTNQSHICPAPTQALLQKWIRETLKIDISINSFISNTEDSKIIYLQELYCDWLPESDDDETEYETYEAALEVALFDGLMLQKEWRDKTLSTVENGQ